MKLFNKFLMLLAALTLVFAFASCEEPKDDDPKEDEEKSTAYDFSTGYLNEMVAIGIGDTFGNWSFASAPAATGAQGTDASGNDIVTFTWTLTAADYLVVDGADGGFKFAPKSTPANLANKDGWPTDVNGWLGSFGSPTAAAKDDLKPDSTVNPDTSYTKNAVSQNAQKGGGNYSIYAEKGKTIALTLTVPKTGTITYSGSGDSTTIITPVVAKIELTATTPTRSYETPVVNLTDKNGNPIAIGSFGGIPTTDYPVKMIVSQVWTDLTSGNETTTYAQIAPTNPWGMAAYSDVTHDAMIALKADGTSDAIFVLQQGATELTQYSINFPITWTGAANNPIMLGGQDLAATTGAATQFFNWIADAEWNMIGQAKMFPAGKTYTLENAKISFGDNNTKIVVGPFTVE